MAHDQESISPAAQPEEPPAPEAGEPPATSPELADATPPAIPPQTLEDASVLDVHPPHEPIHGWKQYLLHMSTIVLGLLIAIGLEQSVEAIHRAHERADLLESLRRDTDLAIVNAKASEQTELPSLNWLTERQQLVRDTLSNHHPLTGRLPRAPHVQSTMPTDPAWDAAKSSGLLSLLRQEDIEAYSQLDLLLTETSREFGDGVRASRNRGQFEFKFVDKNNSENIDLSAASPADLNQYRDLLLDEETAWYQYRILCEYVRGVATAIHDGERDPAKVHAAQYRFYQRKLQ